MSGIADDIGSAGKVSAVDLDARQAEHAAPCPPCGGECAQGRYCKRHAPAEAVSEFVGDSDDYDGGRLPMRRRDAWLVLAMLGLSAAATLWLVAMVVEVVR